MNPAMLKSKGDYSEVRRTDGMVVQPDTPYEYNHLVGYEGPPLPPKQSVRSLFSVLMSAEAR